MKRSALNHIFKIMNETKDGFIQPESFPERCVESIEEMEQSLAETIRKCEERKKDFGESYYSVQNRNHADIQNCVHSLGVRGIDLFSWCLLLMCAISEVDSEVLSLGGKVDQLEAENSRLSLQLEKERSCLPQQ